jgi:hypothetical protein
MYNSFEERALIQAVSRNEHVPGVIVGVGSEIPRDVDPARFRQKFDLGERFAIYVGRIDENKGCRELFAFYRQYSAALLDPLHLVLIGHPVIPVPDHPGIRHLGFVTDQDKFDAMAAADVLVMPSYFESLSMVALEAWALGRPVLANARCDVLHGQCLRSNGGLFYDGFDEFFETLRSLDANRGLAVSLGQNGQRYFERHYSWPVIEGKYTDMLDRLSREPVRHEMEPPAGWWTRRRRVLPPGDAVVEGLPKGPVRQPMTERSRDRRPGDEERRMAGDSGGRTGPGPSSPPSRGSGSPARSREVAAPHRAHRRDGAGRRKAILPPRRGHGDR